MITILRGIRDGVRLRFSHLHPFPSMPRYYTGMRPRTSKAIPCWPILKLPKHLTCGDHCPLIGYSSGMPVLRMQSYARLHYIWPRTVWQWI